METKTPSPPRQGYRRTSVLLWPDQWERLLEIRRETGASPSFTLRKLVDAMPADKGRPAETKEGAA